MTIALGLCFFFIAIPQCQSLECYKRSRFLMGITFVMYGLAIILEQITLKGSSSSGVLARLIIIAISVSQAFMFTSTLVTLVIIPTIYASFATGQERRKQKKAAKAALK